MRHERRRGPRRALKLSDRICHGVRTPIRRPPIVVEIDVEADDYCPTTWGRAAWQGVPLAFAAVGTVRDALAAMGHRARFAWGLRLDPQVAIGEGRPDYILSEFDDQVAAARFRGDSFGAHPHWYRLIDGAWVEDTTDPAWVQQCIGLSLETFRAGFGRTPTWIHFGESWMDQACFNRAVDEGIRLILTPEPGMNIDPMGLPGPFRGKYPTYPGRLRRPYWGSRRNFLRRGLQRRTLVVPRRPPRCFTPIAEGRRTRTAGYRTTRPHFASGSSRRAPTAEGNTSCLPCGRMSSATRPGPPTSWPISRGS